MIDTVVIFSLYNKSEQGKRFGVLVGANMTEHLSPKIRISWANIKIYDNDLFYIFNMKNAISKL